MKEKNSMSIKAILLNLAKQKNLAFQQIITRYLHERLLYRISLSEYKSHFVLKGGNLMYAIEGLQTRPTIDIDMLAKNLNNDKENMKQIFQKICEILYENDCVIFNSETITVSDIAEEKKYSGIRLLIKSQFDTIKQTIQIDIGFGDIIIPGAVAISFPVLLKELDSPEILTYSIETVIAEKFHAMITLGNTNSRMKDFYDVYILLKNIDVNEENLSEAILQTFRHRNTDFVKEHELFIKSFHENTNRNIMWKAFLRKMGTKDNLDFSDVLISITERLYPIYKTLNE
jgi:predicted nucleotidyltransferase component of viral defense system